MPRSLGPDEVDIWVASSSTPLPPPELLGAELSADEVDHSRRFTFEPHRNRFLASRLFRRRVLAGYLDATPAQLTFRDGVAGKPELAAERAGALSFNESESDGVAVIAVSRGRNLGVDVERLRPVPEAQGIVSRFGSAREKEVFAGLSAEEQQEVFLRWWTGKEAFVKALGEGLSMSLERIPPLLRSGGRVELPDGTGWSLHTLEPAPGYVGALVAEGLPPRLNLRTWENNSG